MQALGGHIARLPLAAASVGEVTAGIGVAEHAVIDAVAQARGHAVIEAMCFESAPAIDALVHTLDQGTAVTFLASPVMRESAYRGVPRLAQALDDGQLALVRYADIVRDIGDDAARANTRWQHSKIGSIASPDGRIDAWFSNVAPYRESRFNLDVMARLSGDTATAAHQVGIVTAAAGAGRATVDDVGSVIDAAAGAGLLYNDALTGRRYFTEATDAMVAGATERLLLSTKGLDDPALARGMVDAAQRGVRTGLVTARLGERAAGILRDGGVPVAISPPRAVYDRMNLLVADDTAMLSTGYHTWEVLRLDRHQGIAGRDSAVVLRGGALDRAEAAMWETDRGRVGQLLLGEHADARQGWHALREQPSPAAHERLASAVQHTVDGARFLTLDHPEAKRAIVPRVA